jgi:hypothetical protein
VLLLSVPSTVQHFVLVLRSRSSTIADAELVEALGFVDGHATPGDVLLPGRSLEIPALVLTRCRFPVYKAKRTALVPSDEFSRRSKDVGRFWGRWRDGFVHLPYLRQYGVKYLVVPCGELPESAEGLSLLHRNSRYSVLLVDEHGSGG